MPEEVKLPRRLQARLETSRPKLTAEELQRKEAEAATRAAQAIANKALRAVNSRPGHTGKERKAEEAQAEQVVRVLLECEPTSSSSSASSSSPSSSSSSSSSSASSSVSDASSSPEPAPWWPHADTADKGSPAESKLELFAPSSSEEFWQETEKLAIAQWSDALQSHSFLTARVVLSASECRAVLGIINPSSRASDRRADRETLRGIESRIGVEMQRMNNRCFVKMDSRSPKDVTFVGELSATEGRVLNYELDGLRASNFNATHSADQVKNAQALAVLRACQASMMVTDGTAAIALLLSSARVATDLRKSLKFTKEGLGVVIREFQKISPEREFRAFVHAGKLTAMCQYFHFVCADIPSTIVDAARKFLEEQIIPLLPVASCVVDVAVLANGCLKVIELNPFHYTTGPCLFDWRIPEEVELLKNGPFTWRQRQQVDRCALDHSIASQYWDAIRLYNSTFAPITHSTATTQQKEQEKEQQEQEQEKEKKEKEEEEQRVVVVSTQEKEKEKQEEGGGAKLALAAPPSWQFVPDPVKVDPEGFVPSFTMEQPEALKTFFERYGFVVVRDAISPEDVKETARDMFKMAGFESAPDLDTLDNICWETISGSRYNTRRGFMGYDPSWSEIAWKNRVNANLYGAFALLFDRPDLVIKLDRYGLMRPTVYKKEESEVTRPHWQTESQWLHWDQNPWEEPDFVRIQMVLAISPHLHNTGGFHCIPGAARQWQQWSRHNPPKHGARGESLVDLPRDDPMRFHTQRITMRPGSAVLWDSRTPHGNFPNTSTSWRMCQYMGFHPAPTPEHNPSIAKNRLADMKNLVSNHGGKREPRIPGSVLSSQLHRQLIGLEAWEGDRKYHPLTDFTLSQIGLREDAHQLED